MARFTATEMVGVPLTSLEVRRLLTALDEARLPPASADDDTVLRQKLTVMLQVAEAGERRRQTTPTTATATTLTTATATTAVAQKTTRAPRGRSR